MLHGNATLGTTGLRSRTSRARILDVNSITMPPFLPRRPSYFATYRIHVRAVIDNPVLPTIGLNGSALASSRSPPFAAIALS